MATSRSHQCTLVLGLSLCICACTDEITRPAGPDLSLDQSPVLGDGRDAGAFDGDRPDASGISDVPCEVSDLLLHYCVSCHRSPPTGGAHSSLLGLAALQAQSPTGKSLDMAHDALARMGSTSSTRMPPSGARPSKAEIDAFAAWLNAGMPAEVCEDHVDAGLPPPDPTFSGPTICSSNTHWTRGNHESPLMHPGRACIDCHSSDEGPRYSLAGTLFATGHEPDDCNGTTGSGSTATIEVTDAKGKVVTMTPNAAGNFFSGTSVVYPITAKVLYKDGERRMVGAVDSGDCNTCHTPGGREGAPGRIALP